MVLVQSKKKAKGSALVQFATLQAALAAGQVCGMLSLGLCVHTPDAVSCCCLHTNVFCPLDQISPQHRLCASVCCTGAETADCNSTQLHLFACLFAMYLLLQASHGRLESPIKVTPFVRAMGDPAKIHVLNQAPAPQPAGVSLTAVFHMSPGKLTRVRQHVPLVHCEISSLPSCLAAGALQMCVAIAAWFMTRTTCSSVTWALLSPVGAGAQAQAGYSDRASPLGHTGDGQQPARPAPGSSGPGRPSYDANGTAAGPQHPAAASWPGSGAVPGGSSSQPIFGAGSR